MPKVFRIRRHNLYPPTNEPMLKGSDSLTKQPVCLGRIIETSVSKVENWRADHGQS
jgi:hypothetical protein